MFTPEALRTVIEGTTDIDIQALEEAVRYGDGYSSGHPTIGHFWDVVHGFSAQQRKQLLEFVTASERVPVSGLEGLQFTVMRNGPDTEVSIRRSSQRSGGSWKADWLRHAASTNEPHVLRTTSPPRILLGGEAAREADDGGGELQGLWLGVAVAVSRMMASSESG